jgi:hypothetical protein
MSVPSAFSVSGSPITTSGTLAVTTTGDTTQYIAGDGSLITFPIAGQAGTLVREVRNTTGATLTKGTIVYISGATGNKPTVSKAIATGDSTSAQTFGMLQADLADNANGYVVCVGNITGLDTSALTEGVQLYLSSTTAGTYTTTKQVAPAHLVYIGVVTRSHPTLGQIEVKIQNGYELDEIHDVLITSKSNNDGLFYESSTSLWKNKSIANVLGYSPEQPLTFASPLIRTTNAISIQVANGSQNGYLSSADWTTFNAKQAALSGTGFVKISGTTISYDNSTYLTTSSASSTYVPYTGATQGVNIGTNMYTGGYAVLNGSGTNQAGVLSLFKGTSRAVQGNGYTNLYAEDGKVGFNDWITGNVRTFEFSLASLTSGTTRVYTLPDASGTIALTSNLSSYVPYTGATGAVNLGAYDLTVNSVKIGLGSGNIYDNIIFGVAALASNTSGGSNIAIGYYSLNANTIGGANVAIGTSALTFNTSGANNTAVGYNALTTNTTGSFNTSIGQGTLSSNTTGTRNVAVGLQSLLSNTTASNNSALGNQSLFYNTTGHDNVSIGYQSLNSNTTGNYNTAIGPFSGGYLTTGGYNTIIGGYAGTAGMSSNVILSDGAGNIRFQWDGTNIKLNGNTVGSNAYTSTAYLPLSGGTLTGAINGTSATFSGEIQTTQGIYINRASLPYIQFAQSGTAFAQIRGNGTTFGLTDANGSTYYLGLNTSTGAATFSSSVTVGSGAALRLSSNSTEGEIVSAFGKGIKFYTNDGNSNPLNLTSSGNVGIGTPSPFSTNGTNLEIASSTSSASRLILTNSSASGHQYFFQNQGDGNLIIYDNTAASERMRITSGGNVGIGTTSPANYTNYITQTINGANGAIVQLQSSGTPSLRLIGEGVDSYLDNVSTGALIFRTTSSSSERMRITSSGNVGIGTTAPSQKLDVNGSIKCDGSFISSSQVNSGSFTLDTSATTISLGSLGAVNIGSFSGMVLVTNTGNGVTMLFLCGGGFSSLVSQSTAGAAGTMTNFAGSGYTFTTAYTSTTNYSFQLFRTRIIA